MKKGFLFLALLLVLVAHCFAQAQSIPYQAVARDASGNLLVNQLVALRLTVHDASAGGTTVYQERDTATTNKLGLFTVNVGTGTALSGTFGGISWGSNAKFMQVELDPAGGTAYSNMGTSQMMSVPYALYAAKSGAAASVPSANLTESTSDVLNITGGSNSVLGAGTTIEVKKNALNQDGYVTGPSAANAFQVWSTNIFGTPGWRYVANVAGANLTSSDITVTGGTGCVLSAASLAINKGPLTETGSSVLTITGGATAVLGSGTTVQVAKASAAASGYLSSADWTTFNNKVTAAGTANFVPYFSTTGTPGTLVVDNNGIYDDGSGDIGIGSGTALSTHALLVDASSRSTNGSGGVKVIGPGVSGSWALWAYGPTGVNTKIGMDTSIVDLLGVTVANPGIYQYGSTATSTGYFGNFSTIAAVVNVNNTLGNAGSFVSSAGTGLGILADNTSAAGTGLAGVNSATSGTNTGIGVLGSTAQSGGEGVLGVNTNAAGLGLAGANTAAAGTGIGTGISGTTAQSAGYGVYAGNSNAAGAALLGQNTAASGTGAGNGVVGITAQSAGYGIYGVSSNAGGSAILGLNSATAGTGAGTGVAGSTSQSGGYGVYGTNTTADGIAILGYNNVAAGTGAGTGVSGASSQAGNLVFGAFSYTTSTYGTGVLGQQGNSSGAAVIGINLAATGVAKTGSGVYGVTRQGNGAGVFGENTNAGGNGVTGTNSAASGANTGSGVAGSTTQSLGFGVSGVNANASGAGILGSNTATAGTGTGIGILGTSKQSSGAGLYGYNSNSGTGIIGIGGVNTTITLQTGAAGGSFFSTASSGTGYGVYANATGAAATNYGGYFAASGATTNVALDAAGSFVLGSSGTTLTNVIKAQFTNSTTAIAANSTAVQTFTVTGATVGASVIVSPGALGIGAGLVIGQAYVSAANTVKVVIGNVTTSSVTPLGVALNITVIE